MFLFIMAMPGGLLWVALVLLLAVHLVSPLEGNSSHHARPGPPQELDLASWGYWEEGTSFLMASPQPRLLLRQEANGSAADSPPQTPPGLLKDSSKEPSPPIALPLQVALQVLHDALRPPYVEGSRLTVKARVQPVFNWAVKLYVDECVGSQSQYLNRSQKMYTLVFNRGCLSVGPSPGLWSRQNNETLLFSVEAFMLNDDVEEDEVYIICWASIWSWMRPFEPGRKSCFYNTSSYSWQLADDKWESSVCDCCDFGCSHPKKGRHHEFPGEGDTYMVLAGPLKVKKPPVSWFKASCRTLKDLLAMVLAFSCVTLLLILFLLTLKKVLKVFQLCCPPGCLGNRLREALATLDAQEMGPVVGATERPSSAEETDSVSQSTIEEGWGAADPTEN